MRIIIIGAGKLGYSIAELLSKEEYDIVVVDQDAGRLEIVKETLDVMTMEANGSSPITMDDPEIRDSDVLIAVTANDEVNMVSCILAKKHGIKHTVARIRDMQFISEAKEWFPVSGWNLRLWESTAIKPKRHPMTGSLYAMAGACMIEADISSISVILK